MILHPSGRRSRIDTRLTIVAGRQDGRHVVLVLDPIRWEDHVPGVIHIRLVEAIRLVVLAPARVPRTAPVGGHAGMMIERRAEVILADRIAQLPDRRLSLVLATTFCLVAPDCDCHVPTLIFLDSIVPCVVLLIGMVSILRPMISPF